jgi:3-oxoacyl-[acyl-carrier protein] reductase
MIDTGLKNKIAIVTGANNPLGIGAAIALALAKQGVKLVLHYYQLKEGNVNGEASEAGFDFFMQLQARNADEVIDSIEKIGGKAVAVEGDLSDVTIITQLFEAAEKHFGPVDIVVNNACSWQGDTFLPDDKKLWNTIPEDFAGRPAIFSTETFAHHFAVNTQATALMMTEFAKRSLARDISSGRIINISTESSHCVPSEISYAASKHAMESYTRSAAAELGRYDITANVVSVGPVQSGYIDDKLERHIKTLIPMNRVGNPEDIANAVVFLASEQASWITGQVIYVNGGKGLVIT